jgi:hypothetical protein
MYCLFRQVHQIPVCHFESVLTQTPRLIDRTSPFFALLCFQSQLFIGPNQMEHEGLIRTIYILSKI